MLYSILIYSDHRRKGGRTGIWLYNGVGICRLLYIIAGFTELLVTGESGLASVHVVVSGAGS